MDDPDKIISRLMKRGKDWAEKEAAASLLEETRKSVRAQYAVEYLRDGGSVSKAELLAEADERYREHVEAMVQARKEANLAKVNYDAGRVWTDLKRTMEATKRAEMGLR